MWAYLGTAKRVLQHWSQIGNGTDLNGVVRFLREAILIRRLELFCEMKNTKWKKCDDVIMAISDHQHLKQLIIDKRLVADLVNIAPDVRRSTFWRQAIQVELILKSPDLLPDEDQEIFDKALSELGSAGNLTKFGLTTFMCHNYEFEVDLRNRKRI